MERGPAREAVAAGQQAASHGGGVESGARAKKQAEPASRSGETRALGLEFPRYFTLAGGDGFASWACFHRFLRTQDAATPGLLS